MRDFSCLCQIFFVPLRTKYLDKICICCYLKKIYEIMNFKYYDLLSCIVMGYIALVALLLFMDIPFNKDYSIPYLAIAYVLGYMINALGSMIEKFYYWTIGGVPSDKLLTIDVQKNYTGIDKVKFYFAHEVIALLKEECHDADATTGKMFAKAMPYSDSDDKTRVPDFNAQYAFTRTLLTTMIIVCLLLIPKYYDDWYVWFLLIPLYISWHRYKERGYYYAREVLKVYYHKKQQENK